MRNNIYNKEETDYRKGKRRPLERLRKCKSSFAAGIVLLFVLGLSGCQLAKEGSYAKEDTLCGILITTQEQEDAYWKAHQAELEEPESITLTERELKALQRGGPVDLLGAWDSPGKKVEGTQMEEHDYVFEGLEGASLLAGFLKKDPEGDYRYFTSTGAFENLNVNSTETDAGEGNSIEGTIFIEQTADVIINMNLVYQRPDGSFYALLDSTAGYWNSGETSPGAVFSKSFKEEFSKTLNGKTVRTEQEFTVHVEVGQETKSVCVKEWSGEDKFLGETAVKKGQEHVKLKEDTAYMVVEETKEDGLVERSIYTWDEDAARDALLYHTVRYSNTYGLLEPDTFYFEKD